MPTLKSGEIHIKHQILIVVSQKIEYLATLPASHWWDCSSSTWSSSPLPGTELYEVTCLAPKGVSFEIPDSNHLLWDLGMRTPLLSMNLNSFTNEMDIMWGLSKRTGVSILEAVSAKPVQGYNSLSLMVNLGHSDSISQGYWAKHLGYWSK